MTTSYILDQQRDLKAHKAMMREAEKTSDDNRAAEKKLREEANNERIKAKAERISKGIPTPAKATVSIEAPKAAVSETVVEKPKPKFKAKVFSKKKEIIEEKDDAAEEGE